MDVFRLRMSQGVSLSLEDEEELDVEKIGENVTKVIVRS